MALDLGTPVWTSGKFTKQSALDDLGLESVGAALLRRLIPGVVQTTGNGGYYAFYPYVLAKWEDEGKSVLRQDFKPFIRRQEAAYAAACVLHQHRGPLGGIQGSRRASEAVNAAGDKVNVADLAERYMDSPYGGYGLFYARVLDDIRLTHLGASRYVDRVTDSGRVVAQAFAETFEQTRYYRDFFDAPVVPLEVLAELGQHTCSCSIPGRPDHEALLDVFFGEPEDDPLWAARRRTRTESLTLFLEYHRQRPKDDVGDVRSFRTVLAHRGFAEGTALATPYAERLNSWRLYQIRECETLILTALWSWYLRRLEQLEPVTHVSLRDDLVASVAWDHVGMAADMALADAIAEARRALPDGAALVAAAYATVENVDEPAVPFAVGLQTLLALSVEASDQEPGFVELVDEGGPGRWSLAYLGQWLALRERQPLVNVLSDLLDELHHQHVRVSLTKVNPLGERDPFCFAEDNGQLRLLRTDEPFWTTARFEVVNHLLWTLGLLDAPDGQARPTELGDRILAEAYARA
jgi:hypothetical protein